MDDTTKRCCTCGRDVPLSLFNRRRAAPDGLQPRCRECSARWYAANSAAHKANVRRRNDRVRVELQRLVAEYLAEHPCIDCGESDLRCLEFDHRDPADKTAAVTSLIANALPWPRVLDEILKCDVRCANCHRRVTVERGAWWRQAVYEQSSQLVAARARARLDLVVGHARAR